MRRRGVMEYSSVGVLRQVRIAARSRGVGDLKGPQENSPKFQPGFRLIRPRSNMRVRTGRLHCCRKICCRLVTPGLNQNIPLIKAHKIGPVWFRTITLFVVTTAWLSPAISADEGAPAIDGSGFAPTVPNKLPHPATRPKAWCGFPAANSPWAANCRPPVSALMATMNAVNDAQPIHRVYVDGFWMDKTM